MPLLVIALILAGVGFMLFSLFGNNNKRSSRDILVRVAFYEMMDNDITIMRLYVSSSKKIYTNAESDPEDDKEKYHKNQEYMSMLTKEELKTILELFDLIEE